MFCSYFDLEMFPCTIESVCLYAEFLSRSFKSYQTIRNYVYGVKLLHELLEIAFPPLQTVEYRLTLKGIQRKKSHLPRQAEPITPDILLAIAVKLDFENAVHVTLWAVYLCSFFCMLRISQIIPKSSSKSHIKLVLLRKDVQFKDNMALITIRWSKTNQFKDRVLLLPLGVIPNSILCPVQALKLMVSTVPGSEQDPLFGVREGTRLLPLNYNRYQAMLRHFINLIGRDPLSFSSHSFRRGGATWAFRNKVPGYLIQTQGDWKSDAYKLYLDVSLDQRLLVFDSMTKLFH